MAMLYVLTCIFLLRWSLWMYEMLFSIQDLNLLIGLESRGEMSGHAAKLSFVIEAFLRNLWRRCFIERLCVSLSGFSESTAEGFNKTHQEPAQAWPQLQLQAHPPWLQERRQRQVRGCSVCVFMPWYYQPLLLPQISSPLFCRGTTCLCLWWSCGIQVMSLQPAGKDFVYGIWSTLVSANKAPT